MTTHTFAICAFKDSPYLESCIRSLKGQSIPTKIILCTATPSSFIEHLADSYGLSLFIRIGEGDIQKDWNFAYEQAESELVTIAHQDDVYHKDYVKTLLRWNRRYSDISVFTGDFVVIRHGKLQKPTKIEWIKKLLRLPLRFPALNHSSLVKKSALIFGNPICCPACTYNKKLLGAPLFQSSFHFALDWDMMIKLAKRSGRFICVERPLIYYRIHEQAATQACIADDSRRREEEAVFSSMWPKPVVRLIMKFYQKSYAPYQQ